MTKKHFIALARELRAVMPTDDANMLEQWGNDVMAVARACKASNPAFNTRAFVAACGVPNLLPE